ncbi:retron St85 family RNA-directed DNA polymerase [Enterobacter bugandensis]|uniref:retron St85 family RNA-directed DNA polymerase n=1 Tax=Enterobacter bugandensis TaxID=881260 RepID=UPI002003EA7A|nr:retron St85 family RNA-directed DNA polymerase [Enterobacter bugandensis]MCK6760313.1 retron St85 family RNA-directed DNA polymerase [Enterobacter bugandensis]
MQLTSKIIEKFNYERLAFNHLLNEAPKKYKVYYIPKRGAGFRVIAQPTKELKIVQRFVVSLLEPLLPVHHKAMAYQLNKSIKDNAYLHKDNSYVLKMDFQNFFNKIKPDLFLAKLEASNLMLESLDKFVLKNLLFWRPGTKRSITLILSIGAPSSPFISNFIMYDFDRNVDNWCSNHGIVYSRYADDITFSTNTKDLLVSVPKMVKRMLSEHVPGLTVNESKTIFTSKAHNRHITGVTLTPEGKLSVGRERKRMLYAKIHQYYLGMLSTEDINRVRGLVTFANYIEGDFILRLKKKYGTELIDRFLKEGS